jgi:DedD protein
MALPSLFRRKEKSNAPGSASGQGAAPVEAVRMRARRRLIGAVVLLGIGIVAFPLLFETAPRPIPVDLPIEIPRKDAVAPLTAPASVPARVVTETKAAEPAPPPATAEPKPAPVEPATAVAKVEPKPEAAPEPKPEPKPEAAKSPEKAKDEGARAKALLEGRVAVAPASAGRWVVQIGAFAEDRTVRDVRAKAGKLGLQTYTQVIAVDAGERTRVRVGPFGARDDADAVASKLKQAGLPASVLKL